MPWGSLKYLIGNAMYGNGYGDVTHPVVHNTVFRWWSSLYVNVLLMTVSSSSLLFSSSLHHRYGGRVSDDFERRVLVTYIDEYMGDFIFDDCQTFYLSKAGYESSESISISISSNSSNNNTARPSTSAKWGMRLHRT